MNRCRICDNIKNNKNYKVKEMMIGTEEVFEYFECGRCKTLQISEIPEDLSKYYPKKYYSFSKKNDLNNKTRLKWKEFFVKLYLSKMGTILFPVIKYLNLIYLEKIKKNNCSLNSKILDVGSGIGNKIVNLKNLGFDNLFGSDPFIDDDIHYKNGLVIYKRSIFDFNEKFNLIMFNHSFEHMVNPLEVLIQTNKLLGIQDNCIIRIPVTESYAWEHYQENWVALDAPRHIHLLNKTSMKILAEKTGFKINKFEYESSDYQFYGSEQYKMGIYLMDEKSYYINSKTELFSSHQIKDFKKKAKKLNKEKKGDIMCFYLKKIKDV